MIKLKNILTEAEQFKAKSKESGRIIVYKSKEAMQKAVEDGRAEPIDAKKAGVKGTDLFKSKGTDKIERPKNIDMDRVFQKGRREKRTTDEPKSKFGAKQQGIGAGEKNLKGPQSDADAIGPSAEAEQKVLKQLRAIGPKDNVDLCTVTVPGTNMFCAGNKGIPRAEMPQLKSKVVPGGKADKLVKAGKLDADTKTGEVNTEGMFKDMLEKEGISMSEPKPVLVSKLKATQNQLEGSKVNMFAKVLAGEQPFPDKKLPKEALKKWQDALREPIIVSKEGYILDGHHRWAALVQHDVANGGGRDIEMDIKQVDMGAQSLVDKTNKFTTDMGLAVKVKKPKKESFEKQLLSKIDELEEEEFEWPFSEVQLDEETLSEIIPGTLTDIRKKPGDVWQLVISKRWAAVGPKGWRMAYKANKHGKKNAEMWAKKGKDKMGNSENQLKKDDIEAYGKDNLYYS